MKSAAYRWLTLGALALPALAMGQVPCKVLDPELQQRNYVGGCVAGFAEGAGEASGIAQYKGSFKAGRKHGTGVKVWPVTGDRYEGEFIEDRKEGQGTYTWGARSVWPGEKYSGGYRNDLRHGQGVYEWPSGERYKGPWQDDFATGPATPAMVARAQAQSETIAAVKKIGIPVCRQMRVGIVVLDWIRGTVVSVEADSVGIRIDDAGRYGHTLHGRNVNKGDVVQDAPQLWTPC